MDRFQDKVVQTYIGTSRVHRVTHNVGEEVVLPSKCLHEEHAAESIDRRLFENFMVVRDVSTGLRREAVVGTSTRNEVLVTFDGHGSLVMCVVRRPPSVVRDEDELQGIS